jgi:zinc and cadmium transporter
MTELVWIVGSSVGMMLASVVVAVPVLWKGRLGSRTLLPLVSFAAGSLIGGAFFHLLPEALEALPPLRTFLLVLAGFTTFFVLEQWLAWHRGRAGGAHPGATPPVSLLVLVGDGLHNLIDGCAVASAFLTDVRLGVATWLAVAAHEIPQEIGDIAVLLRGGWSPAKAIAFNLLSAATFLGGALLVYVFSTAFSVVLLVPFAAGNFIYLGAADLVPEINRRDGAPAGVLPLAAFLMGAVAMYASAALE